MPETAMSDAPDISRFINKDSTAEYLPLLEGSLETLAVKLRAQGIPVDNLGRIEELRGHSKSKEEPLRSPAEHRGELLERSLMLLLHQAVVQKHILALRTASTDKAKHHVSMVLLECATMKPLVGLSLEQGLPQIIPAIQKQLQQGNPAGQRKVEQFRKRSQQGVTLEHGIKNSPRGIVKTSVRDLPLLYLTLPENELLELAGSLTAMSDGTKSGTKTQVTILKHIIKSLIDQCARMETLSQQGIMKTPSYTNIQDTLREIQKSLSGLD